METDPERYLREYDRMTEAFVDTFSAYDKAGFDRPVAPGKWSPGQTVEHLILAERGTLRLLNGPPGERGACRPTPRWVAFRDVLLATGNRLEAHEKLLPTRDRHNRVELLDHLVDSRADIRVAVEFARDPDAVIAGYAHPLFGSMTATEWLCFTALHGERHRRQCTLGL